MTIRYCVAWRNGSRGKPYSANAEPGRVPTFLLPYSVFATRSAWRVLAGTGVGGYRTIGDDLKGDDDEGWRVPVLRGPHARAAPRGTGTGLGPGLWSSCWLLRGSRPWSGKHECACLRLCRGPRAARSSGVSRLLVFSAPRRPGIAAIAAGRGRRGRPVWRFVTHAGRGRCRFRRRCRRRGLRSRSGLTARRSRSRNLIHTDPVRPVQPSVQYF